MTIPEEFEKQMPEGEFRTYHWKRSLFTRLKLFGSSLAFGGACYAVYGFARGTGLDIAIGLTLLPLGFITVLSSSRAQRSVRADFDQYQD